MIVLAPVRQLLRLTGLWFEPQQPWLYRLYRVASITTLAMLIQPQFVFLLHNLHDLIMASDVSIQLLSEIMATAKVLFFVRNQQTIMQLIDSAQQEMNRLEQRGRPARFLAADREVSLITRINNHMLMAAGLGHCGGPLLILLYHSLRGTRTDEMWRQPFHCVYLFDQHTAAGFAFAYLLGIAYNVAVAFAYASNDMLYLGLCRYSVANFDSLADEWAQVDAEYAAAAAAMPAIPGLGDRRLADGMRQCIAQHYKIIRFVEDIASSQSGIIFAQFVGAVVVLSTLAFQTKISEDEWAVIMYAIPAICVLQELFIYCFYGNRLSTQSADCVDAIWLNCSWYKYPVQQQKAFLLLMLRLQPKFVLCGFGFFECTLETFVATLKLVGSVLTLLQNIEEQ